MFKFNQLRSIHLEITNNCQAGCPMCSRNIHGGLENPLLKLNSWTIEDFMTIMTPEVLDQVDSYYFCGNFGDPLLNNDLIQMVQYSKNTAPNTGIRIHTNGSLRNKQWWQELAAALPDNHRVIFALDGLQGTHELYRIDTSFDKVIENAVAFIEAGGTAEWAFIRFKHNEHQVDEARALATELGFKSFVVKDSSRFLLDPQFPVYNKQGNVTHNLEPSGYSEIKFIDRTAINNYRSIVANTEIKCQALDFKEVYIDAFGKLFPCCYIAMIPYIPISVDAALTGIREEISKEYSNLLDALGGGISLDTKQHSIKDIINSESYQTVWNRFWKEKKLITCTRTCGVTKEFSKPAEQFTSVESL